MVGSDLPRHHAASDSACPFAKFAWKNRAQPQARFFACLLCRERIQFKSTLLRKRVVDEDHYDICSNTAETPQHLIFDCSFAASFWLAVGFDTTGATTTTPWCCPLRLLHHSLLLAHLWKHRNVCVFNSEPRLLSCAF